MTHVPTDEQLRTRIDELEAELAQRVEEAQEKELQLQRYAADLRETFMQERTRSDELHRSYMLTVRALASAVEARDAYTGRHAERVAAYGLALAEVYGMRLADEPEIEFGFLLHDAGKVAVPDAILFKPGPLTAAERLVMQQHPVTGSEIVRDIEFLGAARDVIRSHHERWDGGGYPDGLAGEDIPGAGVRGRRHARRAHDAAPLSRAVVDRRGASDHRGGQGDALRPRGHRGVQRSAGLRDRGDQGAGRRMSTRAVLIVDDDPFIRKLIMTTLEGVSAFELHEARDGEEAVQAARRESPRLVFLDIDMPRLDGIEACRQMRAEPAMTTAKIVMLTATAEDSARARAHEAGADYFLTKPFSPLELLRLVAGL